MLWMGMWVHHYAVIHVQVGVNFRKTGVWPSLYEVVVSWLRLQNPINCIPHPYWMYTSVLAPWDAMDGHMGTPLCRNSLCRWWGWILEKLGYGRACMMLWCHGWDCKPPLTASHIHIGCMQSVLSPWDAVDGHMGTPLCRNTCADVVEF